MYWTPCHYLFGDHYIYCNLPKTPGDPFAELAKSAVGKLSGLKETYRAMLAKVGLPSGEGGEVP